MTKAAKAWGVALVAFDSIAGSATILGYLGIGPEALASFVSANSPWLFPALAFAFGATVGWWGRGLADAIGERSLLSKLSPAQCAMIVDCLDAERSGDVLATPWRDPVAKSLVDMGAFVDVSDKVGMESSKFSLTPKWRGLASKRESALRDNS